MKLDLCPLLSRFISVAQSLPKTSSVKMVDIWMIYSLLIPFVEVLLQVVLDHIRTREGGKPAIVGIVPGCCSLMGMCQDGERGSAPLWA